MAERITVKDFIEKYNGDVEFLEIREYIPITEKRAIIEELIKKIITEEDLLTTYDSIVKYLVFTIATISVYTNLDATTPEDYDTLRETKLLFEILEKIKGHGDYEDFHNMFEMRFKDYMRDKNTLMGTVNKLLESLKSVMENFDTEELGELLKMLNE